MFNNSCFVVLGTLVGAFIVFGCKLRGRKNALIILVCVLTIIPLVSAFLIHCPETPIAGVTTSYADGYYLYIVV